MMKVSAPLFQLKVTINDKPTQEFHKDGNTFVEGRAGSEFGLEITNLTHKQILVHPTVDGLSAMDGEAAKEDDSSQGYVLGSYQTTTIPGWRLSNQEVAKFFFAGKGNSYAEKTDQGENKGVIGCAVWEQKETPPAREILHWRLSSDVSGSNIELPKTKGVTCSAGRGGGQSVCCSTEAPAPTAETCNLGTGFGEAVSHQVHTTSFVPQTAKPTSVAVIYYDDLEGLRARGLKIGKKKYNKPSLPNPFPKSDKGCTPPPGWRG